MEIEIVKSEPNYAEFILKGERHTLPNLLKSYLLNDSSVEFVSYLLDHPVNNESKFVVRTKGKSASAVISAACKKIQSGLSGFESEMKKALK